MPVISVKVPSVGESITEGILSRWFKPDGAAVKDGEKLFELETDKVTQEIHSIGSGVLKIKVAEGGKVEIGQEVAVLDSDAAPSQAAAPASPPKEGAAPAAAPAPAAPASPPAGDIPLSPAARRVVAETGVDPGSVEGTGKGGRLTKGDVLEAAGKGGNAVPSAPAPAPSPTATAPTPVASAPAAAGPRESRERMSNLRQRIAQRLVEAQQTAAILTTFNEVDMSRVMAIRGHYKDAFKAKNGVNLGFMSFFVKATIEALKAFPRVNARIEGTEIVQCHYYDIGVAVSTEKGLLVPVVRDADKKSFADVEKAIVQYATKARENRIEVSDLQGGTFTITNGGVFGSLLSTPILNPPQSGILGMHSIKERPVAVDGQVVIRPMMYLALSYDHRIIDGREAVSFLVRIKECIEDPERILLDI